MSDVFTTDEILEAVEKSIPAMQVTILRDIIDERNELKRKLQAVEEQLADRNKLLTETKNKLDLSQSENCMFRSIESDLDERERVLKASEIDVAVCKAIADLREKQIIDQKELFGVIFRNQNVMKTVTTPVVVTNESLQYGGGNAPVPIKTQQIFHETGSEMTTIN